MGDERKSQLIAAAVERQPGHHRKVGTALQACRPLHPWFPAWGMSPTVPDCSSDAQAADGSWNLQILQTLLTGRACS